MKIKHKFGLILTFFFILGALPAISKASAHFYRANDITYVWGLHTGGLASAQAGNDGKSLTLYGMPIIPMPLLNQYAATFEFDYPSHTSHSSVTLFVNILDIDFSVVMRVYYVGGHMDTFTPKEGWRYYILHSDKKVNAIQFEGLGFYKSYCMIQIDYIYIYYAE